MTEMLPHDILWIIAGYASENEFLQLINLDKINWGGLSNTPAAIHLLENTQDKIDWGGLSRNPGIFKNNRDKIYKKLIE